MKKIFICIICLLLCSCATTFKVGGSEHSHNIKENAAKMETLISIVQEHDLELLTLNSREVKILSDIGLYVDLMEEEYNKKSDKLKQVKQVLLAYELYETMLTEDEKVYAKAAMYDKIKEIIEDEEY